MGLKSLLLCGLIAVTVAQLENIFSNIRDRLGNEQNWDDTIDDIHGWRLEDHQTDDEHLLLFISDQRGSRYCYVINVSRRLPLESILQNQTQVEMMTEELYALVTDPNHRERPINTTDLASRYHDFEAARECQGHDTYIVRYRPSFL